VSVGPYEILAPFVVDGRRTVHIATADVPGDAEGRLVELIELEPPVDDIEHAYFVGDDVPMWRQVAALGDARLPRLVAAPLRHDGRDWLPCAFTPSVSLAPLRERALEIGGLAVPLVVAIVDDVARALLKLHDAGLVHGSIAASSLAITVDGTARIVTLGPRSYGAGGAVDVFALGAVAYELLGGAPFDPRDELHLLERRADLPPELATFIDKMVAPERRRVRLVDVVDHFVEHVLWAIWTREQIADELRALLPKHVDDAMNFR
jgi:hypothetical protein